MPGRLVSVPEGNCPDHDTHPEGDGWVRRHMTDPGRAEEWTALYKSLGFEVSVRHMNPNDFDERCRACADSCDQWLIIHTRRKGAPAPEDPTS